jgi:hypothetical protein
MSGAVSERLIKKLIAQGIRFNPRDFTVAGVGDNNICVSARGQGSGAALTTCPFQASASGDTFSFTRAGFMSPAGMPTNMFPGGVFFSATITDEVMFLVGKVLTDGISPTSWELELRGTPAVPTAPTPETAPPYFEFDMYVVLGSGATVSRVIDCGNLSAQVVEVLQTDNPDPGCGINPVITHYNWEVVAV